MRKRNTWLIIGATVILGILLALYSQRYSLNQNQIHEKPVEDKQTENYIDISPLNGLPIKDKVEVYKNDIDGSVKYVYITALSTIDEKTGDTVTLSDINQLNQYDFEYNPEIQIIFQEGDDKGPFRDIFTPQATQANAVMRVRGYSARRSPQKSFKIKLNNNTALFLEQSNLNMNKHYYDPLRITNKVCFDLFETIPNFTSLRTQFVNIYIKDISQGESKFNNYGLFTMIEQPNKQFLETHGLDKNGNLYKAQNFSFMSAPALLDEKDPYYNKNEFEKILEIREGKDHTKLISMTKDVENVNLDINDVIDEHFNRDNYLTWMAINIMLGNVDATVSNYLLYSPLNSKTWYFLPWDYDDSLYSTEYKRMTEQPYPETQYGLGLYWGIPLHERFFKDPDNVDALSAKIDEIREKYITTEIIRNLSEQYKPVIKTYVAQLPDIQYLEKTITEALSGIDSIDRIVQTNIEVYYKNLQSPMPFWIDIPKINDDGTIAFMWENAYDLQGDTIVYELQIARDIEFNYLVFDGEEQSNNHYILTKELPPDRYYFRIIARDEEGHSQLSMEATEDERGELKRGVLAFEVLS